MADNPRACVVIDPAGNLSDCEHRAATFHFGTVREGVTDAALFASLGTRHGLRDRCRDCPWLPQCTDFTDCPVENRDCRRLQALRFRSELTRLLRHFKQTDDGVREMSSVVEEIREEGKIEGRAEGRAEGERAANMATALQMLRMNRFTLEDIAQSAPEP